MSKGFLRFFLMMSALFTSVCGILLAHSASDSSYSSSTSFFEATVGRSNHNLNDLPASAAAVSFKKEDFKVDLIENEIEEDEFSFLKISSQTFHFFPQAAYLSPRRYYGGCVGESLPFYLTLCTIRV